MKKIVNKIGQVLQVVLVAPVKLPAKIVHIVKYVALGLGILESLLEEEKPPAQVAGKSGGASPTVGQDDVKPAEGSTADEAQ